MVCHAMAIIHSAVLSVNPNQTPVLTLDQPLYSLAKQIQWNWPDTFKESKFVLVLGSLHIEMAVMKIIGDWLEGSGWTTTLELKRCCELHVVSAHAVLIRSLPPVFTFCYNVPTLSISVEQGQ